MSLGAANQLQIAQDCGQLMLELSQERAEFDSPGFSLVMQDFIVQYLRANGPTSGEIITDAAKKAGIRPPDDRAFGGPFQSLKRRGFIMCDRLLLRVKGHGTPGAREWRLTLKGDQHAMANEGVA